MTRRRLVRGLGKALLGVGVLLGLFAAYQLWGTGIAERQGQKALRAEFETRLASVPPPAASPGATAMAVPATRPPPEAGDAVALIEMPTIGVRKWVLEGVEVGDLKSGPGHYPGTAWPGERGNAAIAGHRTTHGAPFYDLDDLAPGDAIFLTTTAGRFQYDVIEQFVVDPDDGGWVLDPTPDDRLTLTTCNPRYSAAERLIVTARLISAPSDAPPPPTATTTAPASVAGMGAGLSEGRTDLAPALLWGGLAAAIWTGAWWWARAWRRWVPYAVALVPFLVALFLFYDNVARLLPADV